MDIKPYIVISLGWGIQSTTLAFMVALGELPMIDVCIHADTTHEKQATYDYVARWTPWLEERGVKVATVRTHKKLDAVDEYGGCMIPAYMTIADKSSQFSRQCTQQWKRAPIRRYLQANRDGRPVEQWLGISLDEFQRMKDSDVKYIKHRWPLIEKRMTRNDCVLWLERHGLEVPPKSACVFCPFQSQREWHEIKVNGNGDWQKAVAVDQSVRKARPPHDLYVHQSRIPLEEVDLRTPEERGQLSLWDNECSGVCGV